MADLKWYLNRLRAMSLPEIRWRLEQKRLERAEKRIFAKQNSQITDGVFYLGTEDLVFHAGKLPLDALCLLFGKRQGEIQLLGGYSYKEYKTKWHAGFQTENDWPLMFSYDLQYKQRDDIGDARTNWELNRHFQFALLARSYFEGQNRADVEELKRLFFDWNEKNPFLMGISWTSVMEVAIRDINWIVTLGFLEKAMGESAPEDVQACLKELCEGLRTGIINMTSYITAHYSRYSSANNHVIVEAAAMGIAGIAMNCEEWQELSFYILNHEILRQNYPDGINKEMSLHYQSFFMEAVGLLGLVMRKNGRRIPQLWRNMLTKMSRYLSECQGKYGETIVFGDDDAGRILNLAGQEHNNHYQYVLQMMGLLLPERYVEEKTIWELSETAIPQWLSGWVEKPVYQKKGNVCYETGGISIFRSQREETLIGVDHGELGFGSIAAHGHADALSFQMYFFGQPVFADAGTYIYHIDLDSRNAFRKTENHNTVTINEKDQSEMRGAFLWGRRAKTTLLNHNLTVGNAMAEESNSLASANRMCYLEAEQDGYAPVLHKRQFTFEEGLLTICDQLLNVETSISYEINFLLGSQCRIAEAPMEDGSILIQPFGAKENGTIRMKNSAGLPYHIADDFLSTRYAEKEKTLKLQIQGQTDCAVKITTEIRWENTKCGC